MNKKAVEWLYEQLPELVAKGIIPTASVDLIRNHYGSIDKKIGGRTMLTMFALIGAMLVGLGVILILAHNWEQLGRMTRALVTIGMLVTTQILVGFTICFKKDNMVWAESTSTLLMLAIGASIALIGQTYHIADDFSNFLLTWMLLSIPLIYLMDVTAPAILYLAGVTIWIVSGDFDGLFKQLIWILLGIVGPYYYQLVKKDPYANPLVIFSWVFILCVYISFGAAFSSHLEHLYMLIYAGIFASTYFIGILWFDGPVKVWQNPYKVMGLAGCIGLSFLLTFKELWRSIGREIYSVGSTEYLLAFLLLTAAAVLGMKARKGNAGKQLLFGSAPLTAAIGFLLLFLDNSGISSTVLCNGYLLFLSIIIILKGIQEERLGVLNIGMIMVAVLIMMRFLDINFSFVARGVVFVVLGSCFLAANWMMVRRKKEVTK